MDHKRQHWIPQGYLKAWCDPSTPNQQEPYVWQFSRDGRASRRKAPKKIFFETELYTITLSDGTRDLRVEHGLSGLESEFVALRDRKLACGQPLTPEEHAIVCAFVAAMYSRTPFHLGHWRSNWEHVAQMARDFQQLIDAGDTVPTLVPSDGPSFSLDNVEELAAEDYGAMLLPLIEVQLPMLCQMNLSIFETQDELGFITSDAPCVWFDTQVNRGEQRSVGLGSPTVEVTLPISPLQTLALTWQLPSGRIPAFAPTLLEINRRTRLHARDYFVCKANTTKSEWFEGISEAAV